MGSGMKLSRICMPACLGLRNAAAAAGGVRYRRRPHRPRSFLRAGTLLPTKKKALPKQSQTLPQSADKNR
jgi:hypothetical protein